MFKTATPGTMLGTCILAAVLFMLAPTNANAQLRYAIASGQAYNTSTSMVANVSCYQYGTSIAGSVTIAGILSGQKFSFKAYPTHLSIAGGTATIATGRFWHYDGTAWHYASAIVTLEAPIMRAPMGSVGFEIVWDSGTWGTDSTVPLSTGRVIVH